MQDSDLKGESNNSIRVFPWIIAVACLFGGVAGIRLADAVTTTGTRIGGLLLIVFIAIAAEQIRRTILHVWKPRWLQGRDNIAVTVGVLGAFTIATLVCLLAFAY